MPWTVVNGREVWSKPQPDPFVLPPGVAEDSAEAKAMLWERREEFRRYMHRVVVDFVEMHKYCSRKACRRSQSCRSPTVACHDEAKPVLDELFYPEFREMLRKRARR